jgi:hypothetical protein
MQTGTPADQQTTSTGQQLPDDIHLQLGDDSISWRDVLGQLQVFGRLRPFLQELASQKVLLDEIRTRTDLELDPAMLDAAITDFRTQKSLQDETAFQAWLQAEQLDYPSFRMRMYFSCKVKLLKQRIAEPGLEQEFERQHNALERIELSYLICRKELDAQRFAEQLRSGQADFEALARQEVGNPEVTIKADSAPVMRAWLPGTLRAVLDHAQPLELVGPIQQDERWILARINQITPAELDPSTRNRLSNQLFKRWLQSRLSGYSIRFLPTAPQA